MENREKRSRWKESVVIAGLIYTTMALAPIKYETPKANSEPLRAITPIRSGYVAPEVRSPENVRRVLERDKSLEANYNAR